MHVTGISTSLVGGTTTGQESQQRAQSSRRPQRHRSRSVQRHPDLQITVLPSALEVISGSGREEGAAAAAAAASAAVRGGGTHRPHGRVHRQRPLSSEHRPRHLSSGLHDSTLSGTRGARDIQVLAARAHMESASSLTAPPVAAAAATAKISSQTNAGRRRRRKSAMLTMHSTSTCSDLNDPSPPSIFVTPAAPLTQNMRRDMHAKEKKQKKQKKQKGKLRKGARAQRLRPPPFQTLMNGFQSELTINQIH